MKDIINTIHNLSSIDLMKKLGDNTIDLIYMDPPYNTHRDFKEFDDNYGTMDEYLEFILPILKEIHRILKNTGSFYLHVDPSVSHYLKVELDKIFGIKNFRNEIVWCYNTSGKSKNYYPKKHDIILFYSKTNNYNFTEQRIKTENKNESRYNKIDENGNKYYMRSGKYKVIYDGCAPINDYWGDLPALTNNASERLGYPTQKPEALLERIILASSNPGDIVLDPMCGSGTTLVTAHKLNRMYIGSDINPRAVEISNNRISSTAFLF